MRPDGRAMRTRGNPRGAHGTEARPRRRGRREEDSIGRGRHSSAARREATPSGEREKAKRIWKYTLVKGLVS
eukprot:scaffold51480_cov33-Tisochrysis_lutea.AAC.1